MREQAEQSADVFMQALADAPPPPRPTPPEGYAEAFCDGLVGPGDSAADSGPGWGASLGDRSVPVSPQVVALREAVAAVAAVAAMDPAASDPAQALADATAIVELTGALKLTAVARVADVEDRKLHRMDGASTTNSWLRQHESDLTAAEITVARRLPRFVALSAAVADGSIGITSAGRIASQLAKLRRWLDRPDGLIDGQPAEQALHDVIINGVRGEVCPALGGLADDDPRLHALVAQLAEIEQRPASEIDRIEAAFVLLAQSIKNALRLLLDSGILGLRDKVAPHIGVTTGLDTLHGEPGAAPAVGDSGARLPLSLIRQWRCDSTVSRFVLCLGRKVIETSHTERTLKAHERRAKRIETGGRCQVAGCRCGPGAKIIPHHPDAWCRSGTTSYGDTAMLCESNHTYVHEGGTVRLRDGRLLGPDGWVTD